MLTYEKQNISSPEKISSIELKKNFASNAKTDGLFRKIEDNNNQWFAMDFILDHLNETQKITIRNYIKGLIKEEKGAQ